MEDVHPSTSAVIYSWEPVTDDGKREVTDAVFWFVKVLQDRCIINALPEAGSSVSRRSRLIGAAIVERFLELTNEMTCVDTEVLYHEDEAEGDTVEDIPTSESQNGHNTLEIYTSQGICASSVPDENYEPVTKRLNYGAIPLEVKVKAVALARNHPNWNLQTLQKNGATTALKRKKDLKLWESDIVKGGTRYDKYQALNKWTYDRFVESRCRNENVTTRILQEWAAGAALQYTANKDFTFAASLSWARTFKSEYKIRQRHVTKYVSHKEVQNIEDIQNVAALFSTQTASLMTGFNRDYVINTDQTGCEYRVNIRRTLSHKGEKRTLVAVGSKNKLTHSYTAQYAITASGKVLPKVFLCLQETNVTFGPRVIEEVNRLTDSLKNVYITCSRSGKLTNAIYRTFLENVLKPYVSDNKFCLILDSWSGQINTPMYDTMFIDGEGQPTCTVKVIPPNCTPVCQPCDVYFYRQVKNFTSRLQNCSVLLETQRELHNRTDAITIHSIIHNQLSAPIFQAMISYAWYASKLIPEKDIFLNVNQVCFPPTLRKEQCSCRKIAFIRCSWCREYICFECLYDKYHPSSCSEKSEDT